MSRPLDIHSLVDRRDLSGAWKKGYTEPCDDGPDPSPMNPHIETRLRPLYRTDTNLQLAARGDTVRQFHRGRSAHGRDLLDRDLDMYLV